MYIHEETGDAGQIILTLMVLVPWSMCRYNNFLDITWTPLLRLVMLERFFFPNYIDIESAGIMFHSVDTGDGQYVHPVLSQFSKGNAFIYIPLS